MSTLFIHSRPQPAAQALNQLLQTELGNHVEVAHLPAFEWQCLDECIESAFHSDYHIFLSRQAAYCFGQLCQQSALLRQDTAVHPKNEFDATLWFAIGAATARELKPLLTSIAFNMSPRLIINPAPHTSESLLNLSELQQVKGKSIRIWCAPQGRKIVYETLQQRGAKVHNRYVYQKKTLSEEVVQTSIADFTQKRQHLNNTSSIICLVTSQQTLYHQLRYLQSLQQNIEFWVISQRLKQRLIEQQINAIQPIKHTIKILNKWSNQAICLQLAKHIGSLR